LPRVKVACPIQHGYREFEKNTDNPVFSLVTALLILRLYAHTQRAVFVADNEFKALVKLTDECPSLQERKHLLRRMKVLIDEIDALISLTVKRDEQDAT
jgi:hypothetical protein